MRNSAHRWTWMLALSLSSYGGLAGAQSPTLGAGDVIEVIAYDRPDLSGQRVIDPEGQILVPLLGRIAASGMSPEALGRKIAAALMESGQMAAPTLYVDVARWRDIFVSGDVQAPGAFPWRPGLTVRQAIALSGGERRLPTDNFSTYLQAVSAVERAEALRSVHNVLLVRRARLEAELEFIDLRFGSDLPSARGSLNLDAFGSDGPTKLGPAEFTTLLASRPVNELVRYPESIGGDTALASVRSAEELILRDRLAIALANETGQWRECNALQEKLGNLDQQKKILEDTITRSKVRLDSLLKLSEAGLARAAEIEASQTSFASLQTSALDLLAETAQTKISLENTMRALETYAKGLRSGVSAELSTVLASLNENETHLHEARRTAGVARTYLGMEATLANSASALASYDLQRVGASLAEPQPADPTTQLMPGDTLIVRSMLD